MSVVNLTSVVCENNPAAFLDPYRFEITFECLSELREGACAALGWSWAKVCMTCVRLGMASGVR